MGILVQRFVTSMKSSQALFLMSLTNFFPGKTCPPRTPIKELHHANYTQTYMKDAVNCNDKVEWECESCYENTKETEMEQVCENVTCILFENTQSMPDFKTS